MDWLCPAIGGLLIVTLVVTLVGHGIWVMLASLLRSPGSRTDGLAPSRPTSINPTIHSLLTTRREIERLHRSGKIEDTSYRNVIAAIEIEEGIRPRPGAATTLPSIPITPPTQSPRRDDPGGVEQPIPDSDPLQGSIEHSQSVPRITPAVPYSVESSRPMTPPYAPTRPAETASMPVRPAMPIAPPREPRKPFTAMFAAFMEDKNIRWGELIGGMLIVLCSTALVVSLWSQIAAIPVLKFFVFTSVTASMFGVGLYTEHRWKLPTTSRGLLITATLLVPLTFLALSAFSEGAGANRSMSIAAEVVALGVFAALLFWSSKVIAPDWPLLIVLSVLGSSAAQLCIHRVAYAASTPTTILLLSLLPVCFYIGAVGRMADKVARWPTVDRTQANAIFVLLGIASFAAIVPLGLLLFKTGAIEPALHSLSPVVTLLGFPAIVSGLLIWQKVTDNALAGMRTAGTSIGVAGAIVLILGVVLSWPDPSRLIPVACLDFLALASVALLFEIPAAHLPAGLCLMVAYLLGVHVAAGHVNWHGHSSEALTRALLSSTSGTALVPFSAACLGFCAALSQIGRKRHGIVYIFVGAIAAGFSIALVSLFGLGRVEDHGATWVYAIYAAGAIIAAIFTKRVAATWLGSGLLLLALIQGIIYRFGPGWGLTNAQNAWQTVLLVHASITALAGVVTQRLHSRSSADLHALIVEPFRRSAFITSLVSVLPLALGLTIATSGSDSLRVCWLATVWLVLAWESGSVALFGGVQGSLAAAVLLMTVSQVSRQPWFISSAHPLIDPRSLQSIGIGWTVLSWLWVVLRIAMRPVLAAVPPDAIGDWRTRASRFLNPTGLSLDHVLTLASLAALLGLSAYGIMPGIEEEFASTAAATEQAYHGGWSLAPYALGRGSWILLVVLLITLTVTLWERFDRTVVLALLLVVGTACPLMAGRFEGSAASASALRWYLGGYWILASLVIWWRRSLQERIGSRWPEHPFKEVPGIHSGSFLSSTSLPSLTRRLLIAITVVPILVLTTVRVLLAMKGQPVFGPVEGSVFARMGNMMSYAVPLGLVSAGLVGYAWRERSAAYAFSGGLVINYTATLAWLMAAVTAHRMIGSVELIELVQLNLIVAGLYALAWLSEHQWLHRIAGDEAGIPVLLATQARLALVGSALLIVPATLWLVLNPDRPVAELVVVASRLGWCAFVAAIASAGWLILANHRPVRSTSLCASGLAIGSMIAFEACRGDDGGWRGYHTLLVTYAAVPWLILALLLPRVRMLIDRVTATSLSLEGQARHFAAVARCINATGMLVLILALRGVTTDPGRPWWSVGVVLALSLLAAVMARTTLVEHYLSASGLLFNLGATIWWTTQHWQPGAHRVTAAIVELVEVNVIALLIPSLLSLGMRLRGIRWKRGMNGLLSLHGVALVSSAVAMSGVVAVGIACDAQSSPLNTESLGRWLALTSAILLALGCLWDLKLGSIAPLFYMLGLATMGAAVDHADLSLRWLVWNGAVLLAAYSLLTSLLFRFREPCMAWGLRLRVPDRRMLLPPASTWLTPATVGITGAVVFLSYRVVLGFDAPLLGYSAAGALALRLAGAAALLAQAVAVGVLAQTPPRSTPQKGTLLLGALAAVAFGWACMEPNGPNDSVLNRAVVLMVALAATVSGYAFVLGKLRPRESSWSQAGDTVVPCLLGAGFLSLAFILGAEVYYEVERHQVPMSYPAIVAVLLALGGLVGVSLLFAVVPGRDPLKLPDAKRSIYVYAAEILLALAFMHIRLTMPWLFTGFFERYWPVVVMVIAFTGVGLSELFRRQQRLILAEPLERTGALLPMLPVAAFWVMGGSSEVHYSLQLLLVGSLYAVLSVRRRSFGYGVLAALAGNGGLWYMLHRLDGYGLLQHPQLWFIPVALSILVAAHLNRDRLPAAQMATTRYIAMAMIYLSSTIEIFLNGVRQAPWLPLVLAGLSVAGVLVGILLRIRSFLLMGSMFLLISLLTMIYHASADLGWTWLWYVAGIALGLVIITVFALFEKRRNRMLQIIEGLKEWQA